MRSFFYSLLGYFLTPGGLFVMAALDSSLVFFLPLGIDFAVIVLAARKSELFWLYAVIATLGSVVGAAFTFWIGHKIGEHGLTKLIEPSRLERVQQRVGNSAAVTVAALGIIPPPFPFTAFVLTSGAAHTNARVFLATLAGVRFVRFLIEAALAARFGRRILTWMKTPVFEAIIGVLIALAVIGTIVSAIAVWRGSRRTNDQGTNPEPPVKNLSWRTYRGRIRAECHGPASPTGTIASAAAVAPRIHAIADNPKPTSSSSARVWLAPRARTRLLQPGSGSSCSRKGVLAPARPWARSA